MQKRTCNSQALIDLEGKQVRNVHLSTSHGDVFEICFEDGTSMKLCTTKDVEDRSVEFDPDDLYITINNQPLFTYQDVEKPA